MKIGQLIQWAKKQSPKRKILFLLLLSALVYFYCCLPKPLFNKPYSTVLYDANQQLLNARIANDGQWRFPLVDSTPDKFKQCILEFEDKYFEYHPGVNLGSIVNALIRNIKSGKTKSGGSTITMQLARLCRNNPTRSYWEKIIEAIVALRIECAYSKKQILNLYAANAPFGGNTVGVQAAAWRYFGRSPWQLSWAESALLAVLPNAPSLIYPGKNHHLLLKKRNNLLFRLCKKGIVNQSTYLLALRENIPDEAIQLPQLAPHLLQRIVKEKGDGKIYTSTLVKDIQEQAFRLLQQHCKALKANYINNACALILDTQSGDVLAYIGNSANSAKQDHNDVDVVMAPRSSGSILKPLLYGALLSDGKIAPHALVEDVPMQIGSYAPKNFNLTYDGLVPASEALSRSLNVPAVKMLRQCGVPYFLNHLKALGFTTIHKPASHYGLSLILGGAEVSPWDVAAVYASLGRSLENFSRHNAYSLNDYRKPNYLKNGEKVKFLPNKTGLVSAGSIWLTFNAMTELARPDQYSMNSLFVENKRIAWKTGTSFGYRDAWAIGLNQKYTVVVWVGNADGEGRPGLTGINAAAPLLFTLFNALKNNKWFSKPLKDLQSIETCKQTGFRLSAACFDKRKTEVPLSCFKSSICPYHKIIQLDSGAKFQVNSNCYPVQQMKQRSYLQLSPLQAYFYQQHHSDYVQAPPFLKDCVNETAYTGFDIVYPRPGFKIYLPVNEEGKRNPLIMNATHIKKNAHLFWYIDKTYVGETIQFHQMQVWPQKGKHELFITNEEGKSQVVEFEIVDK